MAPVGMPMPPAPGPEVTAQMGGGSSPGAGLSSLVPSSPMGIAPEGGGQPNPKGFLVSQIETVKRVLQQIAAAEPSFAPFADKAAQILDSGLSAVAASPGAPGPARPPEQATGGVVPPPPGGEGAMPPLGA